jgi:hypothetical protein
MKTLSYRAKTSFAALFIAGLLAALGFSASVGKSDAPILLAGDFTRPCDLTKSFAPDCPVPWKNPVQHDIDRQCPNKGCSKAQSPDQLQNAQKNSLCVTGAAVEIGFQTLVNLQKEIKTKIDNNEIPDGRPPKSRATLASLPTVDKNGTAIKLGEGRLVKLEAFVLNAKHDDTKQLGFGGEGVNCYNDDPEWNDVHIVLVENASDAECDSVTAEIIPHFRSTNYDRFDCDPRTSGAVNGIQAVKGLHVVITGRLFYDGSHRICVNGQGSPARKSLWEIHPVFDIQVVSGNQIIPFDEWINKKH